MAVSKRHFEKLAKILRDARVKEVKSAADCGFDNAVVLLTIHIADMCQEENPAFDRSRFYIAAGTPHADLARPTQPQRSDHNA